MTGLWDTTGIEVVKALAAERRSAGGVTSGLALTLVVVVDERRVREAEAAATIAASAHPCRLVIVVRAEQTHERSRLDAEIVVGGRLGPCEAVVLRMQGRLALHAESVVMPLLAPDVPVVTWWHTEPPERIAYDPLGVYSDRRVTDSAQSTDPIAALATRAEDYAPGDTDLAWCRITPWRTLVAGAFDTIESKVTKAVVVAPERDPTAALMRGWLAARLGVMPELEPTTAWPRMREVRLYAKHGEELSLVRTDDSAVLRRTGQRDRDLPLTRRPLGEELAEELRRLDPDEIYAAALGALTGVKNLNKRPGTRVHIWNDPAISEAPDGDREPAGAGVRASGAPGARVADAKRARPADGKKTSAASAKTAASRGTTASVAAGKSSAGKAAGKGSAGKGVSAPAAGKGAATTGKGAAATGKGAAAPAGRRGTVRGKETA